MKLYYTSGACSLSPHIALSESGLAFAVEAVNLRTKITASGANFRTINAKGYVPVLELDDGQRLTEGVAIVLYVAGLVPEKKLAPAAGSLAYFRLVEWLNFIATELHKNCGPLFNPLTPDFVREAVKETVVARFNFVNDTLGTHPYLMGEDFTVADGYLFTVLSWLPHLGLDYSRWPQLEAYLGRVGKRPAVKAVLEAEGLVQA